VTAALQARHRLDLLDEERCRRHVEPVRRTNAWMNGFTTSWRGAASVASRFSQVLVEAAGPTISSPPAVLVR
jgi:hypothetical protein